MTEEAKSYGKQSHWLGWSILIIPFLIVVGLLIVGNSSWIKEHSEKGALSEAMICIDVGRNYIKQGSLRQAEAQFREAIRIKPDLAEGYFSLAAVYRTKGELKQALKYLEKSLTLNPDKKEILYNDIGMIHFQMGNHDKAVEKLHKATELGIREAMIWRNIGFVEMQRENYNDAIPALLNAISARPNAENMYTGMLKEHRFDAVDQAVIDSVKKQLKSGFSSQYQELYADYVVNIFMRQDAGLQDDYLNLGVAYEKTNRFDRAIEAYKTLLELDPHQDHVYNRVGVLLARQERFNEAEQIFRQALSVNRNNEGAQKALNRLRQSVVYEEQ